MTVHNVTQEEGRVRIQAGTLTLADAAMIVEVQTRTATGNDYDLRIDSAIADSVTGASSISKTGSGVLMFSKNVDNSTPVNTYSGGFTLNAGSVFLEDKASSFGTGTLTLGGGNLAHTFASTNGAALTIANSVNVTGTTSLTILDQGNNGNFNLSGLISGSGTLAVNNAQIAGFTKNPKASTIALQNVDLSGFTGTITHNATGSFSGGNRLRFGSTVGNQVINASNAHFFLSGSTASSGANPLDVADGVLGTMKMGELAGTGGIIRAGFSSGGNTTFEVVRAEFNNPVRRELPKQSQRQRRPDRTQQSRQRRP
ncbi:MAG: hypothetical protein QM770_14385 [Tepidisphaeraceae bacterium]